MKKPGKIGDLNRQIFDGLPESLIREIGHFNIFRLETYFMENARLVHPVEHEYYKITLFKGRDQKQTLLFSNPRVSCQLEKTQINPEGYYCIFNKDFFNHYLSISQYEVLQPNGIHLYDLSDEQAKKLIDLYERMFEEIDSDYIYKYDVLRNLICEVMHFAMKIQPVIRDIVFA
jgi:AraC family transcriptional activator of pobA